MTTCCFERGMEKLLGRTSLPRSTRFSQRPSTYVHTTRNIYIQQTHPVRMRTHMYKAKRLLNFVSGGCVCWCHRLLCRRVSSSRLVGGDTQTLVFVCSLLCIMLCARLCDRIVCAFASRHPRCSRRRLVVSFSTQMTLLVCVLCFASEHTPPSYTITGTRHTRITRVLRPVYTRRPTRSNTIYTTRIFGLMFRINSFMLRDSLNVVPFAVV